MLEQGINVSKFQYWPIFQSWNVGQTQPFALDHAGRWTTSLGHRYMFVMLCYLPDYENSYHDLAASEPHIMLQYLWTHTQRGVLKTMPFTWFWAHPYGVIFGDLPPRGIYFRKFNPPLFAGLSLPRTEIRPNHNEGVIWAQNKCHIWAQHPWKPL